MFNIAHNYDLFVCFSSGKSNPHISLQHLGSTVYTPDGRRALPSLGLQEMEFWNGAHVPGLLWRQTPGSAARYFLLGGSHCHTVWHVSLWWAKSNPWTTCCAWTYWKTLISKSFLQLRSCLFVFGFILTRAKFKTTATSERTLSMLPSPSLSIVVSFLFDWSPITVNV